MEWAKWRVMNGFADQAPFFQPDRYIRANGIGLGFRPNKRNTAECRKSVDPAQRIIKDAAQAAGIPEDDLCRRATSFRSELELYLAFERNEIGADDPDYRRAKDIFERNSQAGSLLTLSSPQMPCSVSPR